MAVEIFSESSAKPLVKHDGRYKVVLITPGQGSSALYLEDDVRAVPAAQIWPKGAHSYVDHPTKDNPTRSAKNLIGVLDEDAHWSEEDGGIISYLKPMKHWEAFVEEVAPYTGLSIYAAGTSAEELIDGKPTKVFKEFIPDIRNTVDLVSYAGRGGHFAESLLESALELSSLPESSAGNQKEGLENMPTLEEKVSDLIEKVTLALSELAEARTALVAAQAEATGSVADAAKAVEAAHAVESAEIPDSVKASLLEEVKGGNYEVEHRIEEVKALREEILAEVKAEPLVESAPLVGGYSRPIPPVATIRTVKGW